MSPEEWTQGIRNEAEHVEDAAWAAEARRFARLQRWKATLGSFLLGLLIVEGSVLLLLWRELFFQAHPHADPNFWTWWEMNVVVTALVCAFIAGWRGQRAWPIALAFAAATPLSLLTGLLYRWATHDEGYTFMLDSMTLLRVAVHLSTAYLAVTFGRRFYRPRRAA